MGSKLTRAFSSPPRPSSKRPVDTAYRFIVPYHLDGTDRRTDTDRLAADNTHTDSFRTLSNISSGGGELLCSLLLSSVGLLSGGRCCCTGRRQAQAQAHEERAPLERLDHEAEAA